MQSNYLLLIDALSNAVIEMETPVDGTRGFAIVKDLLPEATLKLDDERESDQHDNANCCQDEQHDKYGARSVAVPLGRVDSIALQWAVHKLPFDLHMIAWID